MSIRRRADDDATNEGCARRRRLQFNGTITFGNVLTILVIVGGFLVGWTRLSAQVGDLEAWRTTHDKTVQKMAEVLQLQQESLGRIVTLQEIYFPKLNEMEQRLREQERRR